MDLGGFFGMDIGGTLAKLVFFLPDKELATKMLKQQPAAQWRSKLASVHQLAGFILDNDRYGATGVRDSHLSIDVPDLGGSFHFIRFETRRTEGALKLAAKHGLAAGMHKICATGGGAHKVGGASLPHCSAHWRLYFLRAPLPGPVSALSTF
jgi:type II pantothenate kinase